MKLDAFCERYCLDARSFEEKNARSLALGKERLAAGKTGQAMRLFAYNHALNQNRLKTSAQAGTGTKWKVRVWKNNKVVKTLTVEKDDEPFVTAKVKSLGVDWDKATVHDPKTMKQQKSYKNANAAKSTSSSKIGSQPNNAKKSPQTETVNSAVVRFTFEDPFMNNHNFEEKINLGKAVSKKDALILAKKELLNGIDVKNDEVGGRFNNYQTVTLSYKGRQLGKWKDNPPFNKFAYNGSAYTNSRKDRLIEIKEIKV